MSLLQVYYSMNGSEKRSVVHPPLLWGVWLRQAACTLCVTFVLQLYPFQIWSDDGGFWLYIGGVRFIYSIERMRLC